MNLLAIVGIMGIGLIYMNPCLGLLSSAVFLFCIHLVQRNEKMRLIELFYVMRKSPRAYMHITSTQCGWDFSVYYKVEISITYSDNYHYIGYVNGGFSKILGEIGPLSKDSKYK